MHEFWVYLAPFLIAAVLIPATIVFGLWLRPSDEWADRVIRDWADSDGWRVAAIDADVRWYDRFRNHTLAYRVRLLDEKGRKWECRAVVGRFLLGQTYRNVAITWTKVP